MQEEIIEKKHSDEITEIITKVPSWLLRWGIMIFGGILLMALSISAVIRYPDTIKLPVKIQAGHNITDTYGVVTISQDLYTKIKVGQFVNIQLKVYPIDVYGQLKGLINYISPEPNDRGLFMVKIKLDTSAIIQPIVLKSWMTGQADVITKDVTVFQRLLENSHK